MLAMCRDRECAPFRPALLLVVLLGYAACHMHTVDPPDGFAAARNALLEELRAEGISDARVLTALGGVPRQDFVRPDDRAYAYVNEALPIDGGQTISQPYIVALMTQLLEL